VATDPQLLVALEARLDRFEKQMREAGFIAERTVKDIEDKFSKANPQFGATFAGNFLGNLAAKLVREIPNFISSIIENFKELERVAIVTGTAMQDVFGIQRVAQQAGASVQDVLGSVRELGNLLNQAARGEVNSLARLFEENKIKLKDVNGEIITTQKALEIVADLVRNAKTEFDKIDIARLAGQSASMVPTLEKGADALRKQQRAAADAAPDLQALANAAKDFDAAMASASEHAKAFAAQAGQTAFANFKLAIADIYEGLVALASLLSRFPGFGALAPTPQQLAELDAFLARMRNVVAAGQAITAEAEATARAAARTGNLRGGGTTTRDPNAPLSRVPVTPQPAAEKDAFERQTDQIEKHIAVMKAEAEAVGLGAKAQEELRIEALLTEAVLRSGVEINDQLADKISEMATRAGEAKERLENLRRAQSELNAASAEFGNALAEAFKAAVLEGKKLEEILKNLANRMASKAIDKLFDLLFATTSSQGTSLFNKLLGIGVTGRMAGGPLAAGQAAIVGERGPELFIPKTGGMVIPNNAISGGGGSVEVKVINNTGQPVAKQESRGPNGRVLEITVGRMVRETINADLFQGGDIDRAMRTRFGLTPRLA
jgi:hypothetical protein